MSLSNIELALIQSGMTRQDIIDKIEKLTELPGSSKKSVTEAAQMLLDAHPGFNLLLEDKDEDIFK